MSKGHGVLPPRLVAWSERRRRPTAGSKSARLPGQEDGEPLPAPLLRRRGGEAGQRVRLRPPRVEQRGARDEALHGVRKRRGGEPRGPRLDQEQARGGQEDHRLPVKVA